MAVTMVIDSGFGDSGKAKLVEYLALTGEIRHVVSGGIGPSAVAHQFTSANGAEVILKQVPSGVLSSKAMLYIGPGTLVDVNSLSAEMDELERYNVRERLMVDRRCGLVLPEHREAETTADPGDLSLCLDNGCAAARASYVMRRIGRVGEMPAPPCAVGDVPDVLNRVAVGEEILIGASDGPEYDLYLGEHYPLAISDGCSVASVLARTGIAWSHLRRVIGVVNMLPTTVLPIALPHRLSPAQMARRNLVSRGLVTGLPRQVAGQPDLAQLARFVRHQRPTELALGRADMFDPAARAITSAAGLPRSVREWARRIEEAVAVPVRYASTGPDVRHVACLG